MSGPVGWYHEHFIHSRRVRVLASHFAELIAADASVLDVGCGDGKLAALIAQQRHDLTIRGIDVLQREHCSIPMNTFDGQTIPCQSNLVDTVMMVDVLHHTLTPDRLLGEAVRVARKQVILKDHLVQGIAAWQTLSVMDHVGNARHGVEIPQRYLTPQQWQELYQQSRVRIAEYRTQLGLYRPPLSWLFERGLHFIAVLEPCDR